MSVERVKQYIEDEGLTIKSRKKEFVFRRMYLYKYLRVMHSMPLEKIGEMFGKNHATIINGLEKFDILYKYKDFWNIVHKEFDLFFIDTSETYEEIIIQFTNMIKWNREQFNKIVEVRIKENIETNEEAIKFIIDSYESNR